MAGGNGLTQAISIHAPRAGGDVIYNSQKD